MGLCPKPRDLALSRLDFWSGRPARSARLLPESWPLSPLSRRSDCVSAEPYPPLRSVQSPEIRIKNSAVYTRRLTSPG